LRGCEARTYRANVIKPIAHMSGGCLERGRPV
jgi:hypothetical protein